jgi:hypothetical protein
MKDDAKALFQIVPVGEENAVSGRLIWQQHGLWSPSGVRQKLNEMAAPGLIERKITAKGAIETSLYLERCRWDHDSQRSIPHDDKYTRVYITQAFVF